MMHSALALFLLFSGTAHAARPETPVILIDPGHGGIDGGTQSADGAVLEKDLNLMIAKKLAEELKQTGFRVELTRETDEDTTKFAPQNRRWGRHKRDLFGRVQAAREKRATVLISVHGNHGTPANRGGIVYYQRASLESFLLADLLQSRFNRLSGKLHHARPGDVYYILRKSPVPSVLVEYGYFSNSRDLANLTNESYQQKLAVEMKEAIWSFITFHHVPQDALPPGKKTWHSPDPRPGRMP